jgi:hypothetical protein
MRRPYVLAAAMIAGGACAGSGTLHSGRTALAPQELGTVAKAKEGGPGGFKRVWKGPGLQPWALLKWDQDHSSAVSEAPPSLLQSIRDELGRLNQRRAKGDDLFLTVTVYAYDRGGWFSDASARCELVARDNRGQVMWVLDGEIGARRALAQTLVDSDESVVARALALKVRQEFNL